MRGILTPNRVPGPGAYDVSKTDFSPEGKYCMSSMPNVLSSKFGKSERANLVNKSSTPSPGSYRLPS